MLRIALIHFISISWYRCCAILLKINPVINQPYVEEKGIKGEKQLTLGDLRSFQTPPPSFSFRYTALIPTVPASVHFLFIGCAKLVNLLSKEAG